jgi:hypothetical protein
MRSALGQFVVGFVITFSPAPFVGFGTYAFIQGQDAPEASATPEKRRHYQMPSDRQYGEGGPGRYYGGAYEVEGRSGDEMEIETDCARRKHAKKERKPEPKEADKPDKPPVPDL